MPIVSGRVLFNTANASTTTGTGVANIPIVLRDISGLGVVVLTDATGAFVFNNVPNGTYTLVEAFGTTGGVASPGDFSLATAIPAPTPKDPPITSMPSPPAAANSVQSLSANTINLSVTANLTGQNFIDGPISDNPLKTNDITIVGSNLISANGLGTYGTLPAGSLINNSPITNPYPGIATGFIYAQAGPSSPIGGRYTVTNTNTRNISGSTWWNSSDHTSKDETGMFAIFNGGSVNATIFNETIPVTPGKYYLSSTFIMNLTNIVLPTPQLAIIIRDMSGGIIFNQSLLNIPVTSIPTWNASGTLFPSGNNTQINYQVISLSSELNGNDFAIDDITVQEVQVNQILNQTKFVDKISTGVGATITYTVEIKNTGQSTARDIVFYDTIPTGSTFVAGSVKVNNTTQAGANPTPPGFTITSPSSLGPGQTMTISFNAVVTSIPSPNRLVNQAMTNYNFVPVVGGSTIPQSIISNQVTTTINFASLSGITKYTDKSFVDCGEIINYTIVVPNTGNVTAQNVVFKDTIPNGTTLVANSVKVNNVVQTGANPSTGINVSNIAPRSTGTINFSVKVQC